MWMGWPGSRDELEEWTGEGSRETDIRLSQGLSFPLPAKRCQAYCAWTSYYPTGEVKAVWGNQTYATFNGI